MRWAQQRLMRHAGRGRAVLRRDDAERTHLAGYLEPDPEQRRK
jgi:hypothetical protein